MGPHTRVHALPYDRYLDILEKGVPHPLGNSVCGTGQGNIALKRP